MNKMGKYSAFLNGASIQAGHIRQKINKYETNAGRDECYEEKLNMVKEIKNDRGRELEIG